MLLMDIKQWIHEVTRGATARQVALNSGIKPRTFSNQEATDSIQPATVVAIARAYGTSPLWGLAALGLITEAEAEVAVEDISDEQLVDEVLRRVKRGTASPFLIGEEAAAYDESDHGLSGMSDLGDSLTPEDVAIAASDDDLQSEFEAYEQ